MKKCTKIVSSTLAGALAVGMVPAMALADDAVELQASEEQDLLEDAQIYSFVGGLTDGQVFTKGADVTALVIDKVYVAETGKNGTYYDNDDATNGFVTKYKQVVNGQPTGDWVTPANIGFYAAYAVWGEGDDAIVSHDYATFSITGASLEGLTVYQMDEDDMDDLSDETFVFENKGIILTDTTNANPDGHLALKINGKNVKTNNFNYKWYLDGYVNQTVNAGTFLTAGKYIIECTPKASSIYYGNKPVEIEVEILPLNVGENVVLADADNIVVKNERPDIASINGVPFSQISGLVDVTWSAAESNTGEQKVFVTAKKSLPAELAASIYGAGSASYLVVDEEVTLDAKYDGTSFNDLDDYNTDEHYVLVNRTVPNYKEFDPAEIENVKSTSGIDFKKDYTVFYFKQVPTTVNPTGWVASSLAEVQNADVYGTFKVVVTVNTTIDGKLYAGTDELYVVTENAAVAKGDVTYTYGPNKTLLAANTLSDVPFDGTDILAGINVTVKTSTGAVVPASEYTVVAKKLDQSIGAPADKWDVVEEIVDWGAYTVEVVSTKYDIKDSGINVTVIPAKAVPTIIDQVYGDTIAGVTAEYIALYTGEVIDPVLGFTNLDVDNDGVPGGDAIAVPADAYKLTIDNFVAEKTADQPALIPTEVKAPGTYTITISDLKVASAKTLKDNYDIVGPDGPNGSMTFELHVTTKNVFADVKADAWYADEVYDVAKNGWITGYKNGLFGPNDGMKRGDLALVLTRALNLDLEAFLGTALDGIIVGDSIISVDTGFSDVKGGAYYALAIKAMAEAGIMTGYEDGTYGPEDLVTRQQLATILCRLDESGVNGDAILMAALDGYADADEVAGWAAKGVEWAVENEIMGVNTAFLNPTDVVTRAEVAAMLVRYDAVIGGLEAYEPAIL